MRNVYRQSSGTFPARHPGRCGACEERIREGNLVRYAENVLVHDDCDAAALVEATPRPVCPDCRTELPLTGVCGVCE